jgi:hypothetical protein
MWFWGRSIDTFEAAIKMLSSNQSTNDHIDCVSGRAFALCKNDIQLLFSCILSDEDAVANLNRYYGKVFEVVSPVGLNSPFVMQVNHFTNMPTIFRKYFPFGHYIQCTIEGDNLIVNDPDGFPRLYIELDICRIERQKAIIWHDNNDVISIDYHQVLGDMFNLYHKEDSCYSIEGNRIFLQYAVRNNLIQTSKIIRLLQKTVGISKSNQSVFTSLFSNMISQNNNSVEALLRVDSQIWSLMEEIWYSKR